jgi:hypothetical protein
LITASVHFVNFRQVAIDHNHAATAEAASTLEQNGNYAMKLRTRKAVLCVSAVSKKRK